VKITPTIFSASTLLRGCRSVRFRRCSKFTVVVVRSEDKPPGEGEKSTG
jgi:hypothetical protein